jgi:hypothetical protein
MTRRDVSIRKGEEHMRYLKRAVLGLAVVVTLGGSLALLGCGGDDAEDASPTNTNNQTFAFANGVAFHPNLNNVPVNLTFLNSSTVFDLQVPGAVLRRAIGSTRFDSCILTVGPNREPSAVGGGSSFPVGTGPQPGEIINLTTCEFDTDNNTLKVESSFGESNSSPAIPATITSITGGS